MRLIDADAIASTLGPLTLVEALRAAHCKGDMGEVERLSVEVPETANSALTWLAWHPARGMAVKTATIFPGNSRTGSMPNIHSVVTLFDAGSGRPLAAIHGESFTRMKTAADFSAGRALARPRGRRDARGARRRRASKDPRSLSSRRAPLAATGSGLESNPRKRRAPGRGVDGGGN